MRTHIAVTQLFALPVLLLLTFEVMGDSAVSYGVAATCRPEAAGGASFVNYKPNQPVKQEICPEDYDRDGFWKPSKGWCLGSYCLQREWHPYEDTRRGLKVKGVVRSRQEGSSIPGAVIDVWQADNLGFYGSIQDAEDEGYCRARLRTRSDGTFEFSSYQPGVHGLLGLFGVRFLSSWAIDIPLYPVGRPLNIVVTADGYLPFAEAYYCDSNRGPCSEMVIDIYLENDQRSSYARMTHPAQVEKLVCSDHETILGASVALCHPQIHSLISFEHPAFFAVLCLVFQIIVVLGIATLNIVLAIVGIVSTWLWQKLFQI